MHSANPIHQEVRNEGELLDIVSAVVPDMPHPELGIGDDAALVSVRDEWSVATMDTMVEGVHFAIGQYTRWADVGWKSIATNQSDIAAMGAIPQHVLVGLNVRRDLSGGDLTNLYEGMQEALSMFGGTIVGGDTVVSDRVSITIAMTGAGATPDTALRSNAARSGYAIAVTGELGDSRGGLELISTHNPGSEPDVQFLVRKHNRPTPRTDLVGYLEDAGVRCATDVSDGLMRDLDKVCVALGLTARVDLDRVPISRQLMQRFPDRALEFALSGGEDYELLVFAPPETVTAVNTSLSASCVPLLRVIGEMTSDGHGQTAGASVGHVRLHGPDSEDIAASLASSGWDHWSAADGTLFERC